MIDVGDKPVTRRTRRRARRGCWCPPPCSSGSRPRTLPKGDVLAVAQVAGIMAAKHTPDIVPLCHPLPLSQVDVMLELEDDGVVITDRRRDHRPDRRRDGGADRRDGGCADRVRHDQGPRSRRSRSPRRSWSRRPAARAATGAATRHEVVGADGVGRGQPRACVRTRAARCWPSGLQREASRWWSDGSCPTSATRSSAALRELAAAADLVVTTGGTGFAPRDVTPEATADVVERPTPGLDEAMRAFSIGISPHGMLPAARSGIVGRTLIVNMPGSPQACGECFDVIAPALAHGLALLAQEPTEH